MIFLSKTLPYVLFFIVAGTIAAPHCEKPVQESKNCRLYIYEDVVKEDFRNEYFADSFNFTCQPGSAKGDITTVLSVRFGDDLVSQIHYILPAEQGPIWMPLFCSNEEMTDEDNKTFNIVRHTMMPKLAVVRVECSMSNLDGDAFRREVEEPLRTNVRPTRPPLQRAPSQIEQVVGRLVSMPSQEEKSKWSSSNFRYLNKRFKLKEMPSIDPSGTSMDNGVTYTQLAASSPLTEKSEASTAFPVSTTSLNRVREPKDSVWKILKNSATSVLKRGTPIRPSLRSLSHVTRQSFDVGQTELSDSSYPASAMPRTSNTSVVSDRFHEKPETSIDIMEQLRLRRKPVVGVIPEESSTEVNDEESTSSRKNSQIIRRPNDLLSTSILVRDYDRHVVGDLENEEENRKMRENPPVPPRHCFARWGVYDAKMASVSMSDDIFLDAPVPICSESPSDDAVIRDGSTPSTYHADERGITNIHINKRRGMDVHPLSRTDLGDATLNEPLRRMDLGDGGPIATAMPGKPQRPLVRQKSVEQEDHVDPAELILDFAERKIKERTRKRGMGVVGKMFRRTFDRNKFNEMPPEKRKQWEEGDHNRPLFTYFVTTTQVLICILSIIAYGFGPSNLQYDERTREYYMQASVDDPSLTSREVQYYHPSNFWKGPTVSDLILLGAKYSPCMRRENKLWAEIQNDRKEENKTGCCLNQDMSVCFQTQKSNCPDQTGLWVKWSGIPKRQPGLLKKSKSEPSLLNLIHADVSKNSISSLNVQFRTAGAVCGQDPSYCAQPSSTDLFTWPDDLTKWPICTEVVKNVTLPKHMTCQLTGRPCCIQQHGRCRIATKEYCDFVRGYYHENATLCSQVDCMSDVCGMLPFLQKERPNQLYRLFTSIFLHAGIIHCIITVCLQLWLMRDIEAMIGWQRMIILYLGSGVMGNLGSAIFVPFNPEVGPSGSIMGVLSATLVELMHYRYWMLNFRREFGYQIGLFILLFIVGTIPYIDNWAHIFGFLFGLCITIIIFPHIDFENEKGNEHSRLRKWIEQFVPLRWIVVFFTGLAGLIIGSLMFFVFFSNIEVECSWCTYLNCIRIPWLTGDHYCDNQGHKLTSWLPI